MTATGTAGAVDVVATRADAAHLERPPLIVLEVLEEFLDGARLGTGPVECRRIGDGQSNATFGVRRGEDRYVVRRGPRPPIARSTHDMLREARVQSYVGARGVPVPEILAVCEDEALLGVPFYVMSLVEGEVITDRLPAWLGPVAERRAASEALVDLLLRVHAVPVDGPEAQALGRPEGYLRRQVKRFRALWEAGAQRDLPDFEVVADRLADGLPETQRHAVVHGDFRVGNVMFAPEAPARPIALLDWEMATLGDPLADLGYLIATYAEPGGEPSVMELTPVTRGDGFLRRTELVERYRRGSELDLAPLPWYQALALWKAAVFCEEIRNRWVAGERGSDTAFGPLLEDGVPQLLALARRAL